MQSHHCSKPRLLTARCHQEYIIGDKSEEDQNTSLKIEMRKSGAKRVVTIIMLIVTVIQLANMQPVFFGVRTYFGLFPPLIILPVSFIAIVFIILHVYQNWPLMLAWFKKSPDKKKQRDKTWRAVVLIAFILVLVYSISSSWFEALTSKGRDIPLESMRVWSWVAYVFLAIHVWQRWRLTFSYFRRSPSKKAISGS